MRRKGLERAHQFSWEQSVRRVRDIYGEVCDSPAPVAAVGDPRRT
jgi:hypothetical protein